jgi:hypothetical protein
MTSVTKTTTSNPYITHLVHAYSFASHPALGDATSLQIDIDEECLESDPPCHRVTITWIVKEEKQTPISVTLHHTELVKMLSAHQQPADSHYSADSDKSLHEEEE